MLLCVNESSEEWDGVPVTVTDGHTTSRCKTGHGLDCQWPLSKMKSGFVHVLIRIDGGPPGVSGKALHVSAH
jgi:hypothetical protein